MWDFITILAGSCLAQIFFRNKAIEDKFVTFYKKFHADANEQVVTKVEYSILPIVGTIVATITLSPETVITQIAAGFSWSATLEAFLNKS